jgi:glycosyltransferase involved in cell wall biosynthesis
VLLVTQSARSIGEFRRPWVRRLFPLYAARYRRHVARAAARLAAEGEVILLAARELVDETALPAGVAVRYYDEESFKIDTGQLARLARSLEEACWPKRVSEPPLLYRGVWLPDVLSISRGLVFRMEVAEPLGAVRRVWEETKPERVSLLSGCSMPERAARLLARRDAVPVKVAAPAFIAARLYDLGQRSLFPREERLRIGDFLGFPRRAVPARVSGSAPTVLFVTCRPRHHFVVDPLIEALRAEGVGAHVIATPTREGEYLRRLDSLGRSGVPWSLLTDHLPMGEARHLVRAHRPVFRRLRRAFERDSGFASRFKWDDLPLGELAAPFFRDSVETSLVAAVVYQEAALRAIDTLRPDAVVITSNRRHTERAVALAARAAGIPCLLFSGALVMGRERSELFDIGDRMLVIGRHLKTRLVSEQGVRPDLISVVGDPRSNAARLIPHASLREEVCRRFDLAPARPLVTVVSKYVSLLFSIQEKEAFYRTVFAALGRLPGWQAVVKVHPNEDLDRLREQIAGWGCPEVALTKEYDIHRLFGASDAAVMVTSMAGLEAIAMGCPVVAAQTGGKDFEGEAMPPYVSAGAVERVDIGDSGGLADALQRVVGDAGARAALLERGRTFAEGYVHPVDGGLAKRLLAVMDDVRAELADARNR